MKLTPAHLIMVVHVYAGLPIWEPMDAPIVKTYPVDLVRLGYIEKYRWGIDKFRITEKGRAFVFALLATPEPQKQWVDGRTGQPIRVA